MNVKDDTAVEASRGSTDTGILTTQNAENTAENGGVEMNLGTKVAKDITLQDEFCSNLIYHENLVNNDTPVKEILLEAPREETLDEDAVNDLLDYNLKVLGIVMMKVKMNKSESGSITSCLVTIQPTPKNTIRRLSVSLRNWNLKTVP